ncbi:pyroglutamyl-peptidase I [Tepidibacillus fermentans]|uniref:Pyrrolidone-carboxylate peptidase n=1 Tax=Tepidibacillus fermentans TaxID=1281767 RepID=A0A4R3KMN0_9BACI|nr:pyroglutamyl-peptidase I [Tepidibacillus fermentans]TCS84198.1 pyroglutamyl-peptidase [Tepidibacillus fermentans]
MKKLLLTGFEPFLEYPINPTEKIVKELNGKTVGHYQIFGHILPVDYKKAADELFNVFDQVKPDVVISLGLAAGRNRVTPERVAINCNDGPVDNQGNVLTDEEIVQDGPAAYFSTLPIRKMVQALQEVGLPSEISNTAGTYLCNHVMYSMLHKIAKEGLSVRAGFIHIPASHELAIKNRSLPSWSHTQLVQAIETIIRVLDEE